MEWSPGEVHTLPDLAKSLVAVGSLGNSHSAGLMLRIWREGEVNTGGFGSTSTTISNDKLTIFEDGRRT